MHLNIEHRTRFTFDSMVNYSIQQLHMTPQDGFGQRVKRWEIRVNGQMRPHADAYGNTAHTLVVDKPHREIEITACGEIETGLDIEPGQDALPLTVYLRQTLLTRASRELAEFADNFRPLTGSMDMILLFSLMHAIRERIAFKPEMEIGKFVRIADVFAAAHGSGQDLAQIFIACCRHLGAPARYVSGYRFQNDGSLMHSHGWADVWLDGKWHSFDVAYGQCANGIHVRLATGLDARDASPVNQAANFGASVLSSTISAQSLAQAQQ
jgi:transglutaminase-like putative cysteine protease